MVIAVYTFLHFVMLRMFLVNIVNFSSKFILDFDFFKLWFLINFMKVTTVYKIGLKWQNKTKNFY